MILFCTLALVLVRLCVGLGRLWHVGYGSMDLQLNENDGLRFL